MPTVSYLDSPLYNTRPVPRVFQNQIDRNLEAYIVKIEIVLLQKLQNAMSETKGHEWTVVFLAVFIILHVAERDMWRLLWFVMMTM